MCFTLFMDDFKLKIVQNGLTVLMLITFIVLLTCLHVRHKKEYQVRTSDLYMSWAQAEDVKEMPLQCLFKHQQSISQRCIQTHGQSRG